MSHSVEKPGSVTGACPSRSVDGVGCVSKLLVCGNTVADLGFVIKMNVWARDFRRGVTKNITLNCEVRQWHGAVR